MWWRGLGSVLPGFLPNFSSQIRVSDITFVTFPGDKKIVTRHICHISGKNVTLSHTKIFVLTCHFLVTSFPKNVTFWPRRYKTFLIGKKCDDLAGTETCFSLPARCRSPHQILVRGSPCLFSNFGTGMTVFRKIQH